MLQSSKRALPRLQVPHALWPIVGPLCCMLAALSYNALAFQGTPPDVFAIAMRSSVVLPIVLALPFFAALSFRLKELSSANQQLGVVASTDSLTNCLNRGAFTASVDDYLDTSGDDETSPRGALLVIDADHFKQINDRFGHDRGDEALVTIAQAIKGVLRETDLVGRIGGEEFSVFLPGADLRSAEIVAERIRRSVSISVFAPGGELRPLSVSIGGAAFADEIDFTGLFHMADRRLYEAKQSGRNRVEIGEAQITIRPPGKPAPPRGLHNSR